MGSGEKALIYLGRYLSRGVIREQDILACANGRGELPLSPRQNRQVGKALAYRR